MKISDNTQIAVLGLGYVGLPLAVAFAEKYRVIGYDKKQVRIAGLQKGDDYTGEFTKDVLLSLMHQSGEVLSEPGIFFTDEAEHLSGCNRYIIAVPTPIFPDNSPDLRMLTEATETVARVLKKNDIVIYESTVYPGCTEETAVPILEKISGLRFNIDFYCGYSPERINPGDRTRTIKQIRKITSGSNPESAEAVDQLYASVITAGTYLAPSIKIAEAAKVIENTQRDVNIALVNELAKIFHLLSIDTQEVLKAAGTKWNFLPFQPGLVGGHCIGIDPYYLAHKAVSVGYTPEMILSARKINDSMGKYVAERVIDLMKEKSVFAPCADVLVMGIAFKENFGDIRNSRVIDIIKELQKQNLKVSLYDPTVPSDIVKNIYNIESISFLPVLPYFSAIIVAVNHSIFSEIDFQKMLIANGVFYDVKGRLNYQATDGKL